MKVRSDNYGGPEENPSCLVNMKKSNALNVYYGNANFHGCNGTLTKGGTVLKAIVKEQSKQNKTLLEPVKPSSDDKSSFSIEPVFGAALEGTTVQGLNSKTRPAAM